MGASFGRGQATPPWTEGLARAQGEAGRWAEAEVEVEAKAVTEVEAEAEAKAEADW